MFRSRLLIVALIAVSFALAAATFRANSSTALASATGSVVPATPMLAPRSGHTATLLPDGKVLIAGGMRRNQDFYKSAETYDPMTNKFQPTGEMSVGRVGHLAILLPSGKVLVAGGWIGRGTTDAAELYDPATGKFTVISKMIARRARASATLLTNGNVLIAGGDDHDGVDGAIASAEIFNSRTLKFQPTGSLHRARLGQTATLLNNGTVLMAGGGGSAGLIADAELYDPMTGTFSETGNLITPRHKHTAGLLPDGRVLIAGGSDERDWNGNLNSAEIYDPRTGKFSPAASLRDSRFKLPDEAVQLPSGRLLVAGGSKSVEVFDPLSGRFLLASGQMNDARHFMSATSLKDGRVLLAGGYPNNDQATDQAWIYRP
jgi:hypothetical protein